MKAFISIIFLLFSNILTATEIDVEDWLLWYKSETQLPFSSSLTIYPPVKLYAENGKLKGFIATPYSFDGENNRIISEFLIIVIDSGGRSHFLEPKLETVGFVGDDGIGMSSLNSELFKDGEVIIQLYKANTSENQKALIERNKRNLEREQQIERTLVSMGIPMPIYNETWNIKGRANNDTEIDEIITSSDLTIFQLYSPYCGFCRKAIPIINALHLESNISVIGMAGPESNSDFNKHIVANGINYPFITYEGDYTESALLRAVGQLGFPTYLVVNRHKKVEGILIGTSALQDWLKY